MARMVSAGKFTGGGLTATGTLVPLGGLTDYGWQQMFQLAMTGATPAKLELALYVDGADATVDTLVEVTSPGYARASVTWQLNTDGTLVNAFDIVIGPVVGDTLFVGAAVLDATDVWFFDDNCYGVITDGNIATFPAGSIVVGVPV